MSRGTSIEWTDDSWNPVRALLKSDPSKIGWHCVHKSEGCRNCYAESFNLRLGTQLAYKAGHERDVEVFLDEKMLLAPLKWKKPRKIFVCSMTDLFADFVSDEMLDRVFAVMALCPSHVFQVLTKRPERMRRYFTEPSSRDGAGQERGREMLIYDQWLAMRASWRESAPYSREFEWSLLDCSLGGCQAVLPLPNVWLGVSVEDQAAADERIPVLLDTPAAVRWLSCEPLLGPVDLQCVGDGLFNTLDGSTVLLTEDEEFVEDIQFGDKIDWVVVGGESGPRARPMHPDWARSLRDQCAAAGVPFLFKQWGEFEPVRADHIPYRPGQLGWASWDGRLIMRPKEIDYRRMNRDNDKRDAAWWSLVGKVGKKAAGRLLDGVQHDGYPT